MFNGLTKSLIFGSAVALIAVYQGFHCTPTAEGILRASTRTVVSSALTVLALDFILTAFYVLLRGLLAINILAAFAS